MSTLNFKENAYYVFLENKFSEKNVDYELMKWWNELFKNNFGFVEKYATRGNSLLFNKRIPDGYAILIDNDKILNSAKTNYYLVIIENKQQSFTKALKQINEYEQSAKSNMNFVNIVKIIGVGPEKLQLKIYLDDEEIDEKQFINWLKKIKFVQRVNNFDIHTLNQWLYDNNINFGTLENKTLKLIELYELIKEKRNLGFINVDVYISNCNYPKHEKIVMKYFNSILIDYDNDVIDKIFNEFLIWMPENHASANAAGVVITPKYIAELMGNQSPENIKTVYDPCAGNGALLTNFKNNPNIQIYANELNETRFKLLKINLKNTNAIITNKDCFEIKTKKKFDFIIMNPPYDDKLHLKFVEYHLNMLSENGVMCVIFPQSSIRNNKIFMDKIRDKYTIIKTIKLNDDVFKPMASVSTVIIVIQNTLSTKDYEFPAYDFTDDGFEMTGRGKNQIRIMKTPKEPTIFKMININSNDWNYSNNDFELPNQQIFNEYYVSHLRGYIKTLLINQSQQLQNQQIAQKYETIENESYNINQKIYNKYKEHVDQKQKLLLASMYKIRNGKFNNEIPFKYYIDTLNINDDYKNYFLEILNTLTDDEIYDVLLNFNENFDFEELFMNIMNWTPDNASVDPKNGIVYTNKLIVENMNCDLKINSNDIYLDFCCGSGNFLFDAVKYSPKLIIGVEIDNLMSKLCYILSLSKGIKIYNSNCFECPTLLKNKGKFTKIAINPPYDGVCQYCNYNALMPKIHMNFVLYGLELLMEGGILAAVIPQSAFKNETFLNELRKYRIIKIISYNSEMFKESGVNVAVSHIIIQKLPPKSEKFKVYQFNQNYKIIHRKIRKYGEPEFSQPIIKSINCNNWNYENELEMIFDTEFLNQLQHTIINNEIEKYISNLKFDIPVLDSSKFKLIQLNDYLKLISSSRNNKIKYHKSEEQLKIGLYSFIGGSKFNNGRTGNLNSYDYENLFTCSKDCGGYIFYHPYKFSINSHCLLLKQNQKINININLPLINYQLQQKFKWNNAINQTNYKEIKCYIYETDQIENIDDYILDFNFNTIQIIPERFKKNKLCDIFKIVKTPKNKTHFTKESNKIGKYPLIGAAKMNYGIVGYLDSYDYENIYTIVITGDGAAGYLFYHPFKFNITSSVFVLKCKIDNFNYEINCPLISYYLHEIQKFNRSNSINKTNFNEIECYIYE